MKMSARRCVGYCLIVAGVLLFFRAEAFFRENPRWSMPVSVALEENGSYLLIVLGVFTILAPILARIVRDYAPGEVNPRTEELEHDSVEERRRLRLPLQQRRSALADRGIVGGALVLLLLIPAFMLTERTLHPFDSKGVYVGLPGTSSRESLRFRPEPIVVSVQKVRQSSKVLLNGKEIPWPELESALKAQLVTRSEWTVFVEGDENLSFFEVISAVDVINNLHGHAVLLTPKMIEEAAERAKASK